MKFRMSDSTLTVSGLRQQWRVHDGRHRRTVHRVQNEFAQATFLPMTDRSDLAPSLTPRME